MQITPKGVLATATRLCEYGFLGQKVVDRVRWFCDSEIGLENAELRKLWAKIRFAVEKGPNPRSCLENRVDEWRYRDTRCDSDRAAQRNKGNDNWQEPEFFSLLQTRPKFDKKFTHKKFLSLPLFRSADSDKHRQPNS
jgi:hypothetical protein